MSTQSTEPASAPFSLADLSPDQKVVWREAYQSGYLAGHEAGWTAADAHANALTRRAAEIVHHMATVPEVDPEEQARLAVARDEARRRLGWVEEQPA